MEVGTELEQSKPSLQLVDTEELISHVLALILAQVTEVAWYQELAFQWKILSLCNSIQLEFTVLDV
jgi:hypothetical protein